MYIYIYTYVGGTWGERARDFAARRSAPSPSLCCSCSTSGGQFDGQVDGQIDGQIDGQLDGHIDGIGEPPSLC